MTRITSTYAAPPTVSACDDTSTSGTLRQAVLVAGSGDTINFSCSGTITLSPSLGPIAINQNLVIDGTGQSVTINGGGYTQLFNVATGGSLTIENLTLTGGSTSGSGGAITSYGPVTVVNSTFNNNTAAGNGGAISTTGALTVTNSTFSGNTAGQHSGAIDVNEPPSGHTTVITGDTFTSNKGSYGGAMAFGTNSPARITNSTFDANYASGDGAALYIYAPVSMSFSTVAGNTTSTTAGLPAIGFASAGGLGPELSVAGSILDNPLNCDTALPSTDKGSNLTYQGGNCNLTSSTDVTGDPQLGSLASNGGPTQTMAVPSNSVAIGAGGCADLSGTRVDTDQRGYARPYTACTIGAYEADPFTNDTWLSAIELLNTSQGGQSYAVNQFMSNQHFYQPNQARWYKFQAVPGSEIHISYKGDPGAVLSLHSDMKTAYEALTTPTNAAAESAKNASSGFLPQSYLPQSYLPQSYLPQSYLPQSYLPQSYLPQSYLPQSYLPQSYLPQSYLPQSYLPQSYLPQSYLPGPYSGAVNSSLLTLSATPNSGTQTIDHFTYNASGYFYVRVVGPADRNNAFTLDVTETTGICSGTSNVTGIPATPPSSIPTGLSSLILWDPSRIGGSTSDISTLTSKLSAFASRPEVNGAVIDLSTNSGVEAAETQSDNHPSCPAAKNIAANDIKSVIQAYRAQNPNLKYIVLVGDDHSIPYFRYPDEAGLGPESQYYPPVADTSALNASLRNNYVLGQDDYGASVDVPMGVLSLPVPDLAVGRLVSTASDVSHMLDVYTNANGTLTPSSALVSGYDFVSDAACNAQADLIAGMPAGGTVDSLVTHGTKTLSSTCGASSTAWTASNLSQKLLSNRHDIVFLAGHFSAGGLEAADYSTSLSSAAVASSSVDMTNTLVLALGCHSGYSIPGTDGVAGISPSPDWAEALAQKGATLFASTGYAYGDTDLNEYGAHLYDNLVTQLRSYSGGSYVPVAVGQAAILAKKEYLATHTNLSGVDEKTLLETALYGLPMMAVNMTGQHINTQPDTSIVSTTTGVTGTGAQFGTTSANVTVQPSLTTHTVPLNGNSVTATYLSGSNGVVARPGEPILPSQVYNVHASNQILRGVGFLGGTYSDLTGVTPLTSAAGTETSVGHPAFYSSVLYPTQVWTPNFFNAISGGAEHLAITPAQYVSSSPTSTSGTLRQFSNLQLSLFYLPDTWTSNGTTAPAAEGAPSTISNVSATSDGAGNDTFKVHVQSDLNAGTQSVWITYTVPGSGTWQSITLAQDANDPTLWTATRALPSSVQFMAQAVNGTGLVTLSNNYGAYYAIGSASTTTLAQTNISLASSSMSGVFQTNGTFSVQLQSNGAAVVNQPVTVNVGGEQGFGTTDASGNVTVTVPLVQQPGSYDVTASFAGGSGYQASSQTLSQTFQVTPEPTSLALSPSTASADYSDPAPISATLTDANGNGLVQKSIVFTVTGNGLTYQTNSITDKNGTAQLGPVPFAAGTYSVSAAFGGQDNPLKVTVGANTVTEQDPTYATPAAPAPVSLTVNPEGTASGDLTLASTGDSVDPINSTLHFSAAVSQANDAYPNDLSKAQVQFTVTDANGNPVGQSTVPLTLTSSLTGVAAYTLPAPSSPNVYNVTETVVGGYFSGSTSTLLAIYDPSAGFVTGGGWINSPAGAYAPNPALTGRANFGFVARYQKGANVPSGQTQFDFQAGSLSFHSSSYEWLVVSGSCKAQFKGSGNLAGSTDQYGFILTAIDGNVCSSTGPDKFRIKIWDNTTGGNVIYDNQMGAADTSDPATVIAGGSIQIHS